MAASSKNAALVVGLVALVVPLVCVDWTQAQKTSKNSFQQTSYSSVGSAPQSVYGGYETQSRTAANSLVAPVQQRRTQQQSYVSRRTESVRQQPAPVASSYQQQEQVSSSSNYDQAEADAEPAQYGKC
jgi:hypothetical protein